MKIGILTYHRTLNYGACLQALATRVVLENMGHEVYYVDYWPDYHQQLYKAFSLNVLNSLSLRGKVSYILKSIGNRRYVGLRKKQFDAYHERYTLPYCRSTEEEYDVIIYGSDQIWRKQLHSDNYNPIYFGKNAFRAKSHVAFSASMGVLPITIEDRENVRALLANLTKIAVRENDLYELVMQMGYNVEQTIDPTLLLTRYEWDAILQPSDYDGPKYMLVYALQSDAFNLDYLASYAHKNGCILKVLKERPTSQDTETSIATAGPATFISLIKYAEVVFTSSFHGLAFSIIYGKEVFASFTHNSTRASSLLLSAGISGRMLTPGAEVPQNIQPIEYEVAWNRLASIRENSLTYLQQM